MTDEDAPRLDGETTALLHEAALRHEKAKEIFCVVARNALNEDLPEKERWEQIVSGVASKGKLPSPAFPQALGEVLYEERGKTPQALDSIFDLADGWLANVEPDAPREVRFLPLAQIMNYAHLQAAADRDNIMMRDVYMGFRELFIDLSYSPNRIWYDSTLIKDALYHTQAAKLSHREAIVGIFSLCLALDPDYELDKNKKVRFSEDDLELAKEFPGAQSLLDVLTPLSEKSVVDWPETSQAETRPSLLREIGIAVIDQARALVV